MGAQSRVPYRDKRVPIAPCVVYSRIDNVIDGRADGPLFFEVEVEVTAAQMIAGEITVLPDSLVPNGMKIGEVTDYQWRWGATPFGTATDIRFSDNNNVDFVTVLVANTNAFHRLSAAGVTQTGVTQSANLIGPAGGGTINRGLKLRSTGTAPTAGSTFRFYARGFFVLV